MNSLRRLRSKVFSKKPSNVLNNPSVSAQKKPRDKRLRHSQSMPLQNVTNIEEAFAQSKPVYKGKYPLKASDIQLVVDSHGCPTAIVQHPAFDPIVERFTFLSSIEKTPHEDVLDQFPVPPSDNPLPCRPKDPAPFLDVYDLYDDLLPPNPAFERQQLLSTAGDQIQREPYRQLIVDRSRSTTSSHRYDTVQPQALDKAPVFNDGYHEQEGASRMMMHSNYSTKSLGANVRLKDGPARRVVVHQPARYEHRPRMHSGASVMDTTSGRPPSRRRYGHAMEPTQGHAFNASTATKHAAEFGYIGHTDSHYHRTPSSSASRSRPPKSSYRP